MRTASPRYAAAAPATSRSMLETGNLGGKCADLNAIFVGMCRSVGVPARDVYGVRVAPSAFGYRELGANSANLKGAQHCRAEAYSARPRLGGDGSGRRAEGDAPGNAQLDQGREGSRSLAGARCPVRQVGGQLGGLQHRPRHHAAGQRHQDHAAVPDVPATARTRADASTNWRPTTSSTRSARARSRPKGSALDDCRHCRSHRPRQDHAREGAHRRGHRSSAGRKKRGISIELGYAFLDTPAGERIGFIDVPGHERLVHTMISGATGIDHALLLVAADDGVMPQTREHLAVLSLLGVDRGAVVITKADRVDATRSAEVRDDAAALLHGTPLSGAPVFVVAATRGDGIAQLQRWLFERRALPRIANESDEAFRLAIDRAFTLDGVGTVVTGTVHAGSVAIGDDLQIVPSVRGARVRVRSLHAQNRAVTEASAAAALRGRAGRREQGRDRARPVADVARRGAGDRSFATPASPCGAARRKRCALAHRCMCTSAPATRRAAWRCSTPAMPCAPGAHRSCAAGAAARRLRAWRGERVVLRDTSASRTHRRRPCARSVRADTLPPHAAAHRSADRAGRSRPNHAIASIGDGVRAGSRSAAVGSRRGAASRCAAGAARGCPVRVDRRRSVLDARGIVDPCGARRDAGGAARLSPEPRRRARPRRRAIAPFGVAQARANRCGAPCCLG